MTVFLYAIEARDLIWDRLTELCGARLTSNYARIGGVARDLPEGWAEKTLATLDRVAEIRDEIDALLNRNRIFVDRTRGVGGDLARGRDRLRLHRPVPARVAASRTTSARRRRTSSTTGSTSTSRSARTATTSTAT